jgi:peptidoglycan/LPS O-acetylase OafA/YrhL
MNFIKRLFLGTEYRGGLQLDELDGIRGLAVLFVLFSHLANENLVLLPLHIAGNASGKIGVYLFFTLSSFLLSRALLEKAKSHHLTLFDWLTYLVRRVTRIYPFYIVALSFVVVASTCGWNLFKPMGAEDLLRHVALLDGKEHFWTIATEVKFYLILPVFIFAYCCCSQWKYTYFIFGLLLISIIAQIVSYSGVIEIRHSLVRYLPVFAMGTIAAVIVNDSKLITKERVGEFATKVSYLLLCGMFLLMPNVLGYVTELVLGHRFNLLVPSSFFWGLYCSAFVLSCVIAKGSTLNYLFRCNWIRVIGVMSFSLYINHWFVLQWLLSVNCGVAYRWIAFWCISFGISAATFLLVERPLSRIKLERLPSELLCRVREKS